MSIFLFYQEKWKKLTRTKKKISLQIQKNGIEIWKDMEIDLENLWKNASVTCL